MTGPMRTLTKTISLASLPLLVLGVVVAQDKLAGDAAPERFVGPDTQINSQFGCSKCHLNEFKAWKETHHNNSIGMPQEELAKAMRKKFKIRNLQRDQLCQNCHFTVVKEADAEVAKYGISCESCHGAADKWAPVHSNQEKWGEDKREERLSLAVENEMIRPASLYKLAQNCYQCHIMAKNPQGTTVSVEEMVNTKFKVKIKKKKKTKYHQAFSKGFELLAWSHGEVRHNLRNTEEKNHESKFKRGLYVVGKLLDVEYTLRALSNAKDGGGRFFKRLKARLDGDEGNAFGALEEIKSKLPAEHKVVAAIDAALAAGKGAPLEPNKSEELTAVAEKVREAARGVFDDKSEPEMLALEEELAPLDPILPKPEAYKGKPWSP